MTIARLKRVTVYGLEDEKQAVLQALQRLGAMHLVPLGEAAETGPPTEPERTVAALKYLLACSSRRRQRTDDADFNLKSVVNAALENEHRTHQATDWADNLRERIKRLEPWGDFRFPPLEALGGYRFWFYQVPHYKMRHLADLDLPWQVVHRDNQNSFVVVLSPEEPPPDAMPVARTHTGALSLGELRKRLDRVENELDQLALERESLTCWIHLMAVHLDHAADAADLRQAFTLTLDRDGVFAVQGWLPVERLTELQALVDERGLAMTAADPTAADEPPTLLENRGALAGGEEVVGFYQMPGYRDWDPSALIFLSFAGFFAMIMADAGYALVIGALLLLFNGSLSANLQRRRLRNMGWAIVAASVGYGIAVGSYFGVTPPEDSLPGALHILDLNDFNAMMSLSVVVGATHLLLANGLTAWHRGLSQRALVPVGWCVAILGGLGLWQAITGAGAALGAGLALVLLFSDTRPVRSGKDVLMRVLKGLLGLTNVTKAFGDVLSYLRLFALGLASASLAVTFNQLAADAADSVPGMGTLLFILIVLLGHALNATLCVVSGVVHGLRLNVIEFYHWGVSDEGYPFKAFAKRRGD